MAYTEKESSDLVVRGLNFPEDLRPDVSKLPAGEELADLLEDIERSYHGLRSLHGRTPTYYSELGVYSREHLLVRDNKVFIPETSSKKTTPEAE